MDFKYFENAEHCIGLSDTETKCDCCQTKKLCFDAEAFYGSDELKFICPDCLASGKLYEVDSTSWDQNSILNIFPLEHTQKKQVPGNGPGTITIL